MGGAETAPSEQLQPKKAAPAAPQQWSTYRIKSDRLAGVGLGLERGAGKVVTRGEQIDMIAVLLQTCRNQNIQDLN